MLAAVDVEGEEVLVYFYPGAYSRGAEAGVVYYLLTAFEGQEMLTHFEVQVWEFAEDVEEAGVLYYLLTAFQLDWSLK